MNQQTHKTLKRVFDILFSAIAIMILSPFALFIAGIIKFETTGPVFFIQNRRTINGKPFKMFKFRTMIDGAQNMGTGLFSFENDSRVTKIGRYLRKTSIDEWPQFINVLKGDMSIVGPRPCTIDELGEYETLNAKFKKRFEVRGGITGLAQCLGRNNNSWTTKVEYDNKYIDMFYKHGVLTDFKILLLTIKSVMTQSGIYEKTDPSYGSDENAANDMNTETIRIAHIPEQ